MYVCCVYLRPSGCTVASEQGIVGLKLGSAALNSARPADKQAGCSRGVLAWAQTFFFHLSPKINSRQQKWNATQARVNGS